MMMMEMSSLDPEAIANRVFGEWPTPEFCGNKGPRHMICTLEHDHTGTHQAQDAYGFWKRWQNDSSQRQALHGEEEYLEAEDSSLPGTQDSSGDW